MELHTKYLDARKVGNKRFFLIEGTKVPILRMCQTSFRYGTRYIKPLPEYNDKIVGCLCAKCKQETERYGLL